MLEAVGIALALALVVFLVVGLVRPTALSGLPGARLLGTPRPSRLKIFFAYLIGSVAVSPLISTAPERERHSVPPSVQAASLAADSARNAEAAPDPILESMGQEARDAFDTRFYTASQLDSASTPIEVPDAELWREATLGWLRAWQRRDWGGMARLATLTWSDGKADAADQIQNDHQSLRLLSAEIIGVDMREAAARVTYTATYAYDVFSVYDDMEPADDELYTVRTDTASLMVIGELAPYEPSGSSTAHWGVNPISALDRPGSSGIATVRPD